MSVPKSILYNVLDNFCIFWISKINSVRNNPKKVLEKHALILGMQRTAGKAFKVIFKFFLIQSLL